MLTLKQDIQQLEWHRIAERVETAKLSDDLDINTAEVALGFSSAIGSVATSLMELKAGCDEAVDELSLQVQGLLVTGSPSPSPPPKPLLRSKRACRASTRTRRLSTPPPPPSNPNNATTHDPRSLPLRHWFLSHLSFPYPSPDQKNSLADACSITRQKVDSDMTNWRRRSGWTDMMVRLGGGEREVMRGMIEGVMLKLEKNERLEGLASEVEFAVDGVRRYLMGEGPRVEMSWMENLPSVTGIIPTPGPVSIIPSTTSTTRTPSPNPRKRRNRSSSISSESSDHLSDSDSEEEQTHLDTQTYSHRPIQHIPSISSLSTTSTFAHPLPYPYTSDSNNGNTSGIRTVSGSSHYSYATDSTFADGEIGEIGVKPNHQSGYPSLGSLLPSSSSEAFSFTPIYASPYGLNPSTTTSTGVVALSRKRPAEGHLSAHNPKVTRNNDHYFATSTSTSTSYHPSQHPHEYSQVDINGSAQRSYSQEPLSYTLTSAQPNSACSSNPSVDHHQSRESSSTSDRSHSHSREDSPSSVTDIETNYIPYRYPSSGSGVQSHASGSGSGSGFNEGQEGGGNESGSQQQTMWSTSTPLPRPNWSTSESGFRIPQEYEFAPRLGNWA